MFYINQQDYQDIPYPTNLDEPESRPCTQGTVASSGCGLCSLMMVVDRLTLSSLSLEEAIRLSHENGADRKVGTNMKILGEVIAEKYDLTMIPTNDTNELIRCLMAGGAVILNVGGDHDDHIGTFSDVGHYIVCIGYHNQEFCILDPAYRVDKYISEGRKGKVREDGKFLYTTAEVIEADTANRDPGYYLFYRKSQIQ